MSNSDDDKRVQPGKTGHEGVAGEKRKLRERKEDSGSDEALNKKLKIENPFRVVETLTQENPFRGHVDKTLGNQGYTEIHHSQAYGQTSHTSTPQQNRHHISSSSPDRQIADSKANQPQNGNDTPSTPGTSSQLTAIGGKSPQSVVSLDSHFAQKSPDGGQQHNWKIDETFLQLVFHNAAEQISSRPRNGTIYEEISDKKTGIRERLKELSHPNSKLSIDIGLEMADGVYLLKLMNMTTSIDVVEKARNMAERGAMFLHIGEELLHRCRETIQSLLNESTPGTETGAVV